jgi:hypothetical protein
MAGGDILKWTSEDKTEDQLGEKGVNRKEKVSKRGGVKSHLFECLFVSVNDHEYDSSVWGRGLNPSSVAAGGKAVRTVGSTFRVSEWLLYVNGDKRRGEGKKVEVAAMLRRIQEEW